MSKIQNQHLLQICKIDVLHFQNLLNDVFHYESSAIIF